MEGAPQKASGKMSSWNASDLRGTMKLRGSTDPLPAWLTNFRHRAVSQRMTSSPRLGTKHVPLAACVDRYSDSAKAHGFSAMFS